jgi:IS5 family transposase
MRFLNLQFSDKIPDSKTIWLFRETLIEKGVIEQLFAIFNETLDKLGVFANEGQMIDASFVEVPRQRNSRDENKQIKEGKTPESWESQPHKMAQKDTDARWTKKNNVSYYGYKNHVKVDKGTKLIKTYQVTPASVHDSQPMGDLLDKSDEEQTLWADSAYTGEDAESVCENKKVKNQIHEKGYRNKPLTEEQKKSNREKSRYRARVEHVFGFIENSMKGSFIRTIGITRAKAKVGLMNLTYNICRFCQLQNMASWERCAQM